MLFKKKKEKAVPKQKAAPSPDPKTRVYKDGNITVLKFYPIGLYYDALESLGEHDPKYNKKKPSKERYTAYEYKNFTNKPVTFDQYKVLINNVIIGYVPPDAYKAFDDAQNGRITSVYANIYGGNYVIVNQEGVWPQEDTLHCAITIRYK